MSWGGVPEDSECKVFAILGTEQGFKLYITDSNFVKQKISKRTGDSKSWNIGAGDNIECKTFTSFSDLNNAMVEIIGKDLNEGKTNG